jgi:hypothetical protein
MNSGVSIISLIRRAILVQPSSLIRPARMSVSQPPEAAAGFLTEPAAVGRSWDQIWCETMSHSVDSSVQRGRP